MGRPLLTPEEIDRLQRYYGTVDAATKQVKASRLQDADVLRAFGGHGTCRSRFGFGIGAVPKLRRSFRFAILSGWTGCPYNIDLRATLIDVYAQAKKSKVAFADLLAQRIQTLEGQVKAQSQSDDNRRRRR